MALLSYGLCSGSFRTFSDFCLRSLKLDKSMAFYYFSSLNSVFCFHWLLGLFCLPPPPYAATPYCEKPLSQSMACAGMKLLSVTFCVNMLFIAGKLLEDWVFCSPASCTCFFRFVVCCWDFLRSSR